MQIKYKLNKKSYVWHNFHFQKVFIIIIIIYSDVKKNDYENVSKCESLYCDADTVGDF